MQGDAAFRAIQLPDRGVSELSRLLPKNALEVGLERTELILGLIKRKGLKSAWTVIIM